MSDPRPSRAGRAVLAALLLLAGALRGGPRVAADEGPPEAVRSWARQAVAERAGKGAPGPAFPPDAAWLNVSRPLSLEQDLRGKVVLLDFWCFCCINCLQVLPDLEHLEQRFAGQAFAVVGVHSAKFASEKDTGAIREAVLRHGIRHPVVNDGDFRIWKAYGARSWPTLALLGPDGRLLGALSGEGHRAELEALVEAALEHFGKQPGVLDARPLPLRLERETRPTAELAYPGKLAVDAARGSLFVSDSGHHRVLELELSGALRRVFGTGEPGLVDGPPGEARFRRPQGLALDGGVLWVADTGNHALRRIDLASGAVRTVAGDGRRGSLTEGERPGAGSSLASPWDVRVLRGEVLIAMAGSHQLWAYVPATGRLRHVAGDGSERRLDAPRAKQAAFAQPSGLAFDGERLYVADSESSSLVAVRLPDGPVETLAGANDDPRDLFDFGLVDGTGHAAKFQHPLGVLVHAGVLYVADTYNDAVRVVDRATGAVSTRWGAAPAGEGTPTDFDEPSGLAAHGTTLYVADTNAHRIRTLDLVTGAAGVLALRGVPVPQASVRGTGMDAWVELPGTVEQALPPARAAAGQPLTLTVRLLLPAGWHPTPGAPGALRVEGAGPAQQAPFPGTEAVLTLPAAPAGEAALTLRLLAYVCQDAQGCRLRSVRLTLPLTRTADGPAAVTVTDVFLP